MPWIILLSLLPTLFCFDHLDISESKEDQTCVPTSKVSGPCHTCICGGDGNYECKKKTCDNEIKQQEKNPGENVECEPNMLYRDGILWCTCSSLGYWKYANCRSNFQFIRHTSDNTRRQSVPDLKCVSNNFYAMDCNICSCVNGKLTKCTSRSCATGIKEDTCEETQMMKIGKELCVCGASGSYNDSRCIEINIDKVTRLQPKHLAILTPGYPIETADATTKCEPGSRFQIDCNKCKCSKNGRPLCTDMLCMDRPEYNAVTNASNLRAGRDKKNAIILHSLDERCIPGLQYKYRCNYCYCDSERRPLCTSMLCVDDFKDSKKKKKVPKYDDLKDLPTPTSKCTPGEVYKAGDGCNRCTCMPGGSIMCGTIACLSDEEMKQLNLNREGGRGRQRPKMRSGGETILPKTKCDPGVIYKKGCQRCFCTHKRTAICTNKPCEEMTKPIRSLFDIRPSIQETELQNPETLPHEAAKCEPGKTYKVDCNWCSCRSNGNTICTSQLCPSFDDVNRIAATRHDGQPCTEASQPVECVSCKCQEGKTKCTTIDSCKPLQFTMRLHESVVSRDEPIQNCQPGMVYKDKCNNCYCQEDRTLRCTRKGCLSFQQVESLKKQRKRLLALEGIQVDDE